MAIWLFTLFCIEPVEYASSMFTILFSSGDITNVASLKYFFSILSEIKSTINETNVDANIKCFKFFLASNIKKLKSPISNTSNKPNVLLNILWMYSIYIKIDTWKFEKKISINLLIIITIKNTSNRTRG